MPTMGTHEDDTRTTPPLPDPTSEDQKLEFPTADPSNDDLIGRLENLVLKSDANHDGIGNADGNKDGGALGSTGFLPLRPYAGDCPHFVRTGTCKFGPSCRYNHPIKKLHQLSDGGLESGISGVIECKYFSTAEGCRYGKSCRYVHPGEESDVTPQLNQLGLPTRLGAKECLFYIRNGSCRYGSRCVYNHPEPASVQGYIPQNPMDGKFVKQVGDLSENRNVGYMHLSGASEAYQAPRSLNKLSGNIDAYLGNLISPQWVDKQPKWNGYQASSYLPRTGNSYSAPIADGSLRKVDISVDIDEFPERPGQPECDFFMKTGDCKFKLTCRFHHPKNRACRPGECVLNENGLPLRPGRSVCRHYERHGLCKFGRACMFDHPASHSLSTYPVWSSVKIDSGGGSCGGWAD
ncbi:hypothetical protein ABFS83_08G004100 [Erythranthe nasuta]